MFVRPNNICLLYFHNQKLQFSIVEIPDIDSTRIVGVELKRHQQQPLFVFGVYLPSDSNTQSYVDELNLLEALTNHYSSFGDVIIGGDFNASINTKDLSHCNVYKSKILKEFITRSDLGCPNTDFKATGSKHTFITTSNSLDYNYLLQQNIMQLCDGLPCLRRGRHQLHVWSSPTLYGTLYRHKETHFMQTSYLASGLAQGKTR